MQGLRKLESLPATQPRPLSLPRVGRVAHGEEAGSLPSFPIRVFQSLVVALLLQGRET